MTPPCLLMPAPLEAAMVRDEYRINDAHWGQLVVDEWRRVCDMVKPEYLTPATLPTSFHLLPVFRARALYGRPKEVQAARYARADIMQPYMNFDEL